MKITYYNLALGISLIALFLVIGYKYVVWNEKRNQAIELWAPKYEECVKKEYNTDPSSYYNQHGTYPECDVPGAQAEIEQVTTTK